MSRRALLAATMQQTYDRLLDRLEGLTDEEFFWRPVPEAWTIFEDRPGRWTYHYAIPDPIPAPMTTIAWQVVHLGTTRLVYIDWAFGPGELTFPEIDIPHTARTAIQFVDDGYEALRAELDIATETGLDRAVKTNWGDMWPAWRIFTTMIDHDALHTGTIGNLRDLYRWTRRPSP